MEHRFLFPAFAICWGRCWHRNICPGQASIRLIPSQVPQQWCCSEVEGISEGHASESRAHRSSNDDEAHHAIREIICCDPICQKEIFGICSVETRDTPPDWCSIDTPM